MLSRMDANGKHFPRNIGVSCETLENTGNMDKLLNWLKTNLLPIRVKTDDVSVNTDARLALRETPEGNLSLSVHALRREPELNRPYFGVSFSENDVENLLKTGNLGRTENENIAFSAVSREKYENRDTATSVFDRLKEQKIQTVQSVEKKEVSQEPPLLYDLTALQKEANSKHGFSADKTLSTAQKLYETKLITYPRTGSRYISEDVLDEIPQLIGSLKAHPRFGIHARKMNHPRHNKCRINKP